MLIFQIFIVVATIRFVTNIFRLYATKFYYYLFKNKSGKLNECAIPVGNLFEKAGTQHVIVCTDRIQSIGQMYRDVISNCLTDPSSYSKLCDVFENTIGVYKLRIRQTFYPMYWITLPTSVLASINFRPNKIVSFLINIVFWLISFIAGYFLEHYLNTHFPLELFATPDFLIK